MALALKPVPRFDQSILPWINDNFESIANAFNATSIANRQTGSVYFSSFSPVGDGATDNLDKFNKAVAAAQGKYLYLEGDGGTKTYFVSGAINFDGVLGVIGTGDPVIKGTHTGDYVMRKTSTTVQSFIMDGVILDAGDAATSSCFRATYVDGFVLRNCTFRNHKNWGVWLGMSLGTSTDLNRNIVIEDNTFDSATTSTYEHLLIFNTNGGEIRRNDFSGTSTNHWGLGLYQQCYNLSVIANDFSSVQKGMYYSISSDGIWIGRNTFSGNTGIQGANEADNGAFGYTTCNNLWVIQNLFASVGTGECLRLGNVDRFEVAGNVFRNSSAVCIMDAPGSLSTVTAAAAKNGSIHDNFFYNNNTPNTSHDANPPIKFNTGVTDSGVDIYGNHYRNGANLGQQRNIIFDTNTFTGYHIHDELFDTGVAVPVKTVSGAVLTPRGVVRHTDANYTCNVYDRLILLTVQLTADRTITLPAANAVPAGESITIADVSGGIDAASKCVISRAGGDTINGGTSKAMSVPGVLTFYSDGISAWAG